MSYYKEEVKENEEKLAGMKANNKDPYDIKKFEEVLGESYMMVPDSSARLKQALQDLAAYVMESPEVTEELHSNEWYIKATELLEKERDRYEEGNDQVEETKVDDIQDGEVF